MCYMIINNVRLMSTTESEGKVETKSFLSHRYNHYHLKSVLMTAACDNETLFILSIPGTIKNFSCFSPAPDT